MTRQFKILVVDDSAAMRQLLCLALKRLGNVELVEACDGLEGLKSVRQGDIDLALIDINMPNMDGLNMIRHIRSDPQYGQMPVVIITTKNSTDSRDMADKLGVDHYITKPINQSQVLDIVRAILQIK